MMSLAKDFLHLRFYGDYLFRLLKNKQKSLLSFKFIESLC